jgi:hypothetical protein
MLILRNSTLNARPLQAIYDHARRQKNELRFRSSQSAKKSSANYPRSYLIQFDLSAGYANTRFAFIKHYLLEYERRNRAGGADGSKS